MNHFKVNNSQVADQPSGITRRTVALGQGERVDPNIENGLRVTFNFRNPIAAFFNQLFTPQRPNYYVWETDYTRYAVGSLHSSIYYSVTNFQSEIVKKVSSNHQPLHTF